ncbi:hypothetical protein EVAR_41495_1 [Eumeta japonica]|uniref:Uncharacterized protein n=1 Tax=Eumeta variegata TaxID=151549 RepID=A0A4C1X3B9_EUMVA|nr:hypothetical protein EVAR_41495_1 [Eumeta japonica]
MRENKRLRPRPEGERTTERQRGEAAAILTKACACISAAWSTAAAGRARLNACDVGGGHARETSYRLADCHSKYITHARTIGIITKHNSATRRSRLERLDTWNNASEACKSMQSRIGLSVLKTTIRHKYYYIPPHQYVHRKTGNLDLFVVMRRNWETIPLFMVTAAAMGVLSFAITFAIKNKRDKEVCAHDRYVCAPRTSDLCNYNAERGSSTVVAPGGRLCSKRLVQGRADPHSACVRNL